MKTDVLNTKGEIVKDITLNKEIFNTEVNNKVLKDALTVAMNSLRQGTSKTKTRSEVRGGGRKPYKQKGTGNARQGSIRATQWVGGATVFGPIPRSYSIKQNRKERKIAIKSAYSFRANNKDIVVVDNITLSTPKTKEMMSVLNSLKLADKKVLIVVSEYTENLILASRNIPTIAVITPSEVGVLDIIGANKLLVEEKAMEEIKEALK